MQELTFRNVKTYLPDCKRKTRFGLQFIIGIKIGVKLSCNVLP